VQVVARRTSGSPAGPLPLIFGPMAGVNHSNVSRTAIAVIGGPSIGAGLILLHPDAGSALHLNGTGNPPQKIRVNNGAVQVNSVSDDAVTRNGGPSIVADGLYVGGNQPELVGSSIFPNGTLGINSPPVADPLAHLPVPPQGPTNPPPSGGTLQPGFYPSGLPGGNQTLASGIYYIRGGLSLNGNRTLDARAGVMLYIETGSINMGGNSNILINPMPSGTYAGISIFVARGNTSGVTLRGTSGANNSGTFYMPSSHVSIQGNPTGTASQVIASTLNVQGSAQLVINYNGSFPVQGHRIWLAR
jgi:hypothetical protein